MGPLRRSAGLLLALVAVPALTGCSALGLPDLPGSSILPFGGELVDPAASPDPLRTPDPDATPGFYSSLDGYALTLPSSWATATIEPDEALPLTDLLAATDPTLGALARLGLETSGARVSLIAVDVVAASAGGFAPALVVLALETRGQPRDTARSLLESVLRAAPLDGEVAHTVVTLPAADAHRYDAVLLSESVTLRLRADVFRIGGDSFIVAAVAPVDSYAAHQQAFDAIVKGLRFGV